MVQVIPISLVILVIKDAMGTHMAPSFLFMSINHTENTPEKSYEVWFP